MAPEAIPWPRRRLLTFAFCTVSIYIRAQDDEIPFSPDDMSPKSGFEAYSSGLEFSSGTPGHSPETSQDTEPSDEEKPSQLENTEVQTVDVSGVSEAGAEDGSLETAAVDAEAGESSATAATETPKQPRPLQPE